MEKYREIQVCYQCSAKLLKHVSEVFHYGMEAVVNPIRPIFVPEANDGSGALTALCIRALRRIFIMADKDKVPFCTCQTLKCQTIACYPELSAAITFNSHKHACTWHSVLQVIECLIGYHSCSICVMHLESAFSLLSEMLETEQLSNRGDHICLCKNKIKNVSFQVDLH